MTTQAQLQRAVAAKHDINFATSQTKNHYLHIMTQALRQASDQILRANKLDLQKAKGSISPVMLDRLTLTQDRIEAMAQAIDKLIELEDPVGKVIDQYNLYNGIHLTKIRVPFGLIGVIYESRPNVTADVAALAIKSGNAVLLRGGKEAYESSKAIVDAMRQALEGAGANPDILQLIEDTSRDSALAMMKAKGYLDLLIPRGGAGLIQTVVEQSLVPVIETGTGICHIYVDESADLEQTLSIIDNAKTSRPSVCNAVETLLVHEKIAGDLLPRLEHAFSHPVQLRADQTALTYLNQAQVAQANDFDTEFSDYILAVKCVASTQEAIDHINQHSTGHSEAILSQNPQSIAAFTQAVDSAAVYVNASTRFTDGGEFGLGCEVGISTQKLHARGPMGLEALTSYKTILVGDGQIR